MSETNHTTDGALSSSAGPTYPTEFNDAFLSDFFKECGREITLAFTTLNQMKNWAIVVTGAALAAVVSVTRWTNGENSSDKAFWSYLLVASAITLILNVRFFVRAMFCYVNLIRWNKLQSSIIRLRLKCDIKWSGTTKEGAPVKDLAKRIDEYYHRWLSPIARWEQISSTLKLGFGFLLALPLIAVAFSTIHLDWDSAVWPWLTLLAGGLAIEAFEFLTSTQLDTPDRNNSRPERRRYRTEQFPSASGRTITVVLWAIVLIVSLAMHSLLPRANSGASPDIEAAQMQNHLKGTEAIQQAETGVRVD